MSAWGVVAFVGQVKFFAAGRDSMRAIKVGGLGVATSRRGLFLPVVERWSSVIVERIDTDTVIFKVPDRVIDETWAVIRPAVEAMGFPAG